MDPRYNYVRSGEVVDSVAGAIDELLAELRPFKGASALYRRGLERAGDVVSSTDLELFSAGLVAVLSDIRTRLRLASTVDPDRSDPDFRRGLGLAARLVELRLFAATLR